MNKLRSALASPAMQSRSMVIILTITGILVLLTLALTSKTISAYHAMQDVKAQTVTMQDTIAEWQQQKANIEHQKLRPVSTKDVDSVNRDLLFLLQANRLTLTSYQYVTPSSSTPDPYRTYQIKFTGAYNDVIHFLTNFQAKDALVGLLNLQFSRRDDLMEVDAVYRIYLRDVNITPDENGGDTSNSSDSNKEGETK